MALTLTVKIDEPIQVGSAVIRVVSVGKKDCRISIEAPQNIEIHRSGYMFPDGYGAELQANGRWILCVPDDDGRPMHTAYSSYSSREEALAAAKGLTS